MQILKITGEAKHFLMQKNLLKSISGTGVVVVAIIYNT